MSRSGCRVIVYGTARTWVRPPDSSAAAPGAALAIEGHYADQGKATYWRVKVPSSGTSASEVAVTMCQDRGLNIGRGGPELWHPAYQS